MPHTVLNVVTVAISKLLLYFVRFLRVEVIAAVFVAIADCAVHLKRY